MKSNYKPQPIDTKDVQLSDELNALVEIVAKNVHEVWAQSRIEQGWSFGVERNDVQKNIRVYCLMKILLKRRRIMTERLCWKRCE